MRSRCYQVITDNSGNVLPNSAVRLLQPGTDPATDTLVAGAVYAAKDGVTALGAEFTTSSGVVEFWMDESQFVQIAVTPPESPEFILDNVPVFQPMGSTVGSTRCQAGGVSVTSVGGSKRALFHTWAFSPTSGVDHPGPDLVANSPTTGDGGIQVVDAGWYQVRATLWAGFSDATPSHVGFGFGAYNDNDGVSHDVVCTSPMPGGLTNRVLWGAQASIVSHVFFQPGQAETDPSGIQFSLYWPGAGTLVSGNGTDVKFALRLDIARLG